MNTLDQLFKDDILNSDDPCAPCSILNKNLPVHCIKDYEFLEEADILFLSDSFKFAKGAKTPFSTRDMELLADILVDLEGNPSIEFSASVKCPSIKESDMTTTNRNTCRYHLEKTIDAVKPKLIFTCGNLPMKMLLKKSGLGGQTSKRGMFFDFVSENGHECKVVPLFHPFQVTQEPKNRVLFESDIKNAYKVVIQGKTTDNDFEYDVVMDEETLDLYATYLPNVTTPIAADVETTGLDFQNDKIQTISFSWREEDGIRNIVFPVYHKDSPWTEEQVEKIVKMIAEVMSNKAIKVLHNAKFDLKFMMALGVREFTNIQDTMLLAHNLDEDKPGGLMSCVRVYFPGELEGMM